MKSEKIISLESEIVPQCVLYNLSLEDSDTFFANGILTHNTPGTLEGKSSTVGGETVSFGANPSRKMPVRKDGDQWTNLITGDENFALAKHIQLHGTQPYPFVRPVLYHKLRAIVLANLKRHSR